MDEHDCPTIEALVAATTGQISQREFTTLTPDGVSVGMNTRARIETPVYVGGERSVSVDIGTRVRAWVGEDFRHLTTREWVEDADRQAVTEELVAAVRLAQGRSRPQSLQAVIDATAQRAVAEAASETAQRLQAAAIRAALDDGQSVADLVAATGLSVSRIYQIRDGRR